MASCCARTRTPRRRAVPILEVLGRSTQCKACRRQRQNRGGYGTCRNRALAELARRHHFEYQHYREQARLELAPDTATAEVWDQARGRALAEVSRRHRAEWHQHYQQVRAAHPDWPRARALNAATIQQRRVQEYEALYAAERAKIGNPVRTARVALPKPAATHPGR